MKLPKVHYLNYNGSPVMIISRIDTLNVVVTALGAKLPEGILTLTEAPEHHGGNYYRCRIIPEVEEVLQSLTTVSEIIDGK